MEYYWLDVYKSKRQQVIREQLLVSFLSYLRVGQARLRVSRVKALDAVSCFICNSLRAINKGKTEISISLDKRSYNRIVNGKKEGKISYRYTRPLLDFMVHKGFIELDIGEVESWVLASDGSFVPDKTTHSKIIIKPTLVELLYPYLKHARRWQLDNVLILRDSQGNDIEFPLNKRTREMIRTLNDANKILGNCEITLDGEYTGEVQMRRIFNEDFEKGGRFYTEHGVVQCEKQEDRLRLQINGENVVELDYSNLHPRLAYSKLGITLPENFDCYHLDNWQDFGTDYSTVRSMAKSAVLIAINCYSRREAGMAIAKEYYNESLKGEESAYVALHEDFNVYKFMDALIEIHSKIADQIIYGGFGPQFQYDDSCISEYIYNHFNKRGEPVVCIHDSYVVRESLEDELREVMEKAYKSVVGSAANCKIDRKGQ